MPRTSNEPSMSDPKHMFSDLSAGIVDYLDTWYKLTIVSGTRKATHAGAALLALVSVVFMGLFVLFFGGLALGTWLGDLLNSAAAGYGLTALFFLVVMLVLVSMRKKIVFPFMRDLIIRKLYERTDEK